MTTAFATTHLAEAGAARAPDGSRFRPLLRLAGAAMARFDLEPGQVSYAVSHRTVEEIWLIVAGRGEMWRKQGSREEIVPLRTGVCLTVPLDTQFQFRASDAEPVSAIVVTLPPWPNDEEAVIVGGPWMPSKVSDP